jgi:hypothetical protein
LLCIPDANGLYGVSVDAEDLAFYNQTKRKMSLPTRSLSTHMRAPSLAAAASSTANPSPALVARVEEKKAELENLRLLRDLSAAVAMQMEALESKLATLSDGTEGLAPLYFPSLRFQKRENKKLEQLGPNTRPVVFLAIAAVVGNWHNVLRAINMAASE